MDLLYFLSLIFFLQSVDIHFGTLFDTKALKEEVSNKTGWSELKRRKFITDTIQTELFKLGEEVGNLPSGTASRILRENLDDSL